MVGAGAKILGPVKIGDNVKIGANTVVIKEVPPNSVVVGVPRRIVARNGKKIPPIDVYHGDLPDPVIEMIRAMQEKIEHLEKEVQALKKNRKGD